MVRWLSDGKGADMDYRDYYGNPFRSDLAAVVNGLRSPHGEEADGGAILQPRSLSSANSAIVSMAPERRSLFATALFFTVLVDEVAYTHFQKDYAAFRTLTVYPKLLGDCPGGCHYHLEPSTIFRAFASPEGPATGWTGAVTFDEEAVEVMRFEVLDFFRVHLPQVSGEEFWAACVNTGEIEHARRVRRRSSRRAEDVLLPAKDRAGHQCNAALT